MIDNSLQRILHDYPYPVLFATLTGSHAFGCASPTSDYDVHGIHLLPVQEVLGLGILQETIEQKTENPENGLEVDIATHDLKKFVCLLLKGNGNVLEDLYSPLVVASSPIHDELKELGKGCITKQIALHYRGHVLQSAETHESQRVEEIHPHVPLFADGNVLDAYRQLRDEPVTASR